ncbi:uncharacterized protein HD556DRAFT_1216358, partial [Suillus plorans]
RLVADPNLQQCPDFLSAVFQACRTPLLNHTMDDAQAANTLQDFWMATNTALKVQWQAQLDANTLETADQQCLLDEATEQHLLTQKAHDAILAEEDRKKNCIHLIPIPDHLCPKWATDEVLVADFALCKLDKAQFVELYYWTNKGLADAKMNYRTSDDDSMVATAGIDGSTTWISASAARPAAGVIPDHLLSSLDFSRAVPHLIASLKQCGWPNSRVIMLANFFSALMLHKY